MHGVLFMGWAWPAAEQLSIVNMSPVVVYTYNYVVYTYTTLVLQIDTFKPIALREGA